MPQVAYLSLGSNIGDREAQLGDAIARLAGAGTIVAVSSFYETEPVEVTGHAWFVNCAVSLETNKTPEELLAAVLAMEQEMGRRRMERKGPRSIDIDIVLFGDRVVKLPGLSIPHPAMERRRFVLEPLAEIAAGVRHPVLKKAVRELLEALPAGQVVRKTGKRLSLNSFS